MDSEENGFVSEKYDGVNLRNMITVKKCSLLYLFSFKFELPVVHHKNK